jgi:uncharacterized membrane protein
MPMLLALSSVYSPDGIGTTLVALFVSYCLRLHEKDNIDKKEMLKLLILLALAATIKSIGYVGITLIVFILPLKKIILQNKKYIKYVIPLLMIAILGVLLVLKATINAPGDTRSAETSNREQFEYILNNPFQYSKVLTKHTIDTFSSLRKMSFLNAPMFFRDTYYNIFLIMSVYLIFISITDSSKHLKTKDRIIFAFTFFAVFAIVSTSMYLGFTKVGANYINGVQMRYIFPILPLVLMSISVKKLGLGIENKFKYSNLYLAYPMMIFLIISVLDLSVI